MLTKLYAYLLSGPEMFFQHLVNYVKETDTPIGVQVNSVDVTVPTRTTVTSFSTVTDYTTGSTQVSSTTVTSVTHSAVRATTTTTSNPVSVTGTTTTTTTVTGSTPGTTTYTVTTTLSTSRSISAVSSQTSTSSSSQQISSTVKSTGQSASATTTKTAFATSLTTGTDGAVTQIVTETDTVHDVLTRLYSELASFAEHFFQTLTNYVKETDTPIGVQVNSVTITVPPTRTILTTTTTTIVGSTASSNSTRLSTTTTTVNSESSTTPTAIVNPVSVTSTSWTTTTVSGSTAGSITNIQTSTLTTSTSTSSFQTSSSSVSTETLSKTTTSTVLSTIGTRTTIAYTVVITTGTGGTVTKWGNETDTVYAYLSKVFDELDRFVVHVTNFLTDTSQQTKTPLGVQINSVTVTTAPNSNFKAEMTNGTQLNVQVVVDSDYAHPKTTPFSMPSLGQHTFTAPWSNSTNGVVYNFVQWNESNAVVSTSPTFTYNLQSSKTFTAIYAAPSYTVDVIVYDNSTTAPVVGASVSLDGNVQGLTNLNGERLISGVTAGDHTLDITDTGYNEYTTTITVTGNSSYIVYLQTSTTTTT